MGSRRSPFVSSTGEQCVDLGVTPDETVAYEITFRNDAGTGVAQQIFGARRAVQDHAFAFSIQKQVKDASVTGWTWSLADQVYFSQKFYNDFNVVTFDAQHRAYVNNQFVEQFTGVDETSATTDLNFYLFTLNNNGVEHAEHAKISLRRFKLWKGGELVRDCVGAVSPKRTVGLYDLVTGDFLVSKSGTSLVAGVSGKYVFVPAHKLPRAVRRPSDYWRRDYVSSTGAQYLDAGILPDETVSFQLSFRNRASADEDTHLFGSRLAFQNNAVGLSIQKTVIRTHFAGAYLDFGAPDTNLFQVVELTPVLNVYVNGAYGPLVPTADPTIDNPNPIYVFSCNDNGKPHSQYSSIDLRNCRIWKGGELVRDYVPARHGDEVGLYDLVGKCFKPADSETPLVAGPAADKDHLPPAKQLLGVSLPGDYVLLSHVRTDASATGVYFDTGVTADETTAYEVTFRDDRQVGSTDEMMILGSREGYGTNDLSLSKSNWLRWRYGDIKWNEQYAAPTELDFCVVKFETPCFKVDNVILAEAPSSADMTENGLNVYLFTLNNNCQPHAKYAKVS